MVAYKYRATVDLKMLVSPTDYGTQLRTPKQYVIV